MKIDSGDALVNLGRLTGYACAGIGAGHFALGSAATVPGASNANATTDSLERFLSVVFALYGLAWVRAVQRDTVAVDEVRALSATMAVGGAGRLLSWAHRGRPHWFQLVLAGVEFVVPAVFESLCRNYERTAAT